MTWATGKKDQKLKKNQVHTLIQLFQATANIAANGNFLIALSNSTSFKLREIDHQMQPISITLGCILLGSQYISTSREKFSIKMFQTELCQAILLIT